MMLGNLKVEQFKGREGERFALEGAGGKLELLLVEVKHTRRPIHAGATREPFILLFRGPPERPVPQNLYNLRDPRLGLIEGIFMVPVTMEQGGALGTGMFYEAIMQ
ncbi:hypothetical protein SAMN06265365_13036 [Tistlia consotensis]|uniref:DUF6916 domain-containing protein n=1 Tax=Tistlia consotensis USBA 355 TaxID=560819 RepID=A0A1Y6CRN9_9PROT|nr:hypothetical protein [Tistlia consotensis]SMF72562.1 hypothetical protein SAMN05428998_13136 [Tistlia consotensis USBA 355]SNS09378.1 hypothetical protein SAMN06265365_13036 [Tistlia consotensis]